jgi:apolipoprotein N-acyltransferase
LKRLRSIGPALAGGLCLVFIYPRWDLTFLAPLVSTFLLLSIDAEPRLTRRFLTGWLAGAIAWGGACYWIRFVIDYHGGLNFPLSVVGFLIFAFYKGLQMGVFFAAAGPLWRSRWAALAIPALWVGIERTHGTMGFAWLTLGNAAIDYPIVPRLAPVVGVYGCSFWFALVGTLIALAVSRRAYQEWAPAAALLAAPLLFPALPEPANPDRQAAVLQPNVNLDLAWTQQSAEAFRRRAIQLTLAEALKTPAPDLVAWPETPAPLYFETDPVFRGEAQNLARLAQRPFLLSSVTYNRANAPLNSAVFLQSDGTPAGKYDKMYLVPFGEFVPSWFAFVNRITQEAGDFAPGDQVVLFPIAPNRTAGSFICYESAFPHLVRQFTAQGAQVLFNLSNDGYFGDRAAREQHVALVRMRAIENARWIVRPTNNGITVSVDPRGGLHDRLPQFSEQTGRLGFSYQTNVTPYVRYGDWFAWTCLVFSSAAAMLLSRRRV